ncbi:hypothetical protein DUI87_05776 [Hirundo rustica rustica]|uniref:Uncharacterized protein n=1 Tax=Hirundo rustica rustica TaxID=333673 RepID=A0A3M0KV83_HIRRU|nr:hypothetical protein DUI87_05776 [Hirundo rustica rustica]
MLQWKRSLMAMTKAGQESDPSSWVKSNYFITNSLNHPTSCGPGFPPIFSQEILLLLHPSHTNFLKETMTCRGSKGQLGNSLVRVLHLSLTTKHHLPPPSSGHSAEGLEACDQCGYPPTVAHVPISAEDASSALTPKQQIFCPKWSPPTPSASPILSKSTLGFILATFVWKKHPHIPGHIRILFKQLLFHNSLNQHDNCWPKSQKYSFHTAINKLTSSSCFKLFRLCQLAYTGDMPKNQGFTSHSSNIWLNKPSTNKLVPPDLTFLTYTCLFEKHVRLYYSTVIVATCYRSASGYWRQNAVTDIWSIVHQVMAEDYDIMFPASPTGDGQNQTVKVF